MTDDPARRRRRASRLSSRADDHQGPHRQPCRDRCSRRPSLQGRRHRLGRATRRGLQIQAGGKRLPVVLAHRQLGVRGRGFNRDVHAVIVTVQGVVVARGSARRIQRPVVVACAQPIVAAREGGADGPALEVLLRLRDESGRAAAPGEFMQAAERYRALWQQTAAAQPLLLAWLTRRPLQALELADRWQRLLGVVAWVQAHPRPGSYLRQVGAPNVDSTALTRRSWRRSSTRPWTPAVRRPGRCASPADISPASPASAQSPFARWEQIRSAGAARRRDPAGVRVVRCWTAYSPEELQE